MSGLDIDLRQPVEQAPEPGGPAWKRSFDWLREVLYSWGPPILVVLVIRSILCEPFQIPSGSMVPTLAIGDFILVSKFSYGLRIPFTQVEVLPLAEPKRGEIIVFIYPPSQSEDPLCWLKTIPHTLSFGLVPGPECGIDYIKRIVGEPGDTIEVRDNLLFINGEEQRRQYQDTYDYTNDRCSTEPMKRYEEDLEGLPHPVLQSQGLSFGGISNYGPITVPEGHFFVMGDNRDNSADSRVWGFVPRENVRGKAELVWLSFNGCEGTIRGLGKLRGERIGQMLK